MRCTRRMHRIRRWTTVTVLITTSLGSLRASADVPGLEGPAAASDTAVRLAPPPPPPPLGPPWTTYDCESFRYLFEARDLPWAYFGRVMARESHCDPMAFRRRSRDWSFGLLQINTLGALWNEIRWRCGLTSRTDLFDPETNVACAAQLYAEFGTRPWRV
jgi:hypothetical protein